MADSQPESKLFSVRIVSIDHYMAPPIPGYDFCYSSFQGDKVLEVPIIRVYGSTPAGQKTCLHVHRALPYLYVPCADIPLQPNQEDNAYTHAVAVALEKALKLKGKTGSKRQHVHGCSLVRGKRFYGYHSSEELFVKIYLYYPHDVARAGGFLLGGVVLDKSLQPHESHIPFILQFMVDYNLYGMGHLHLLKVNFRHPVPDVSTARKFNYNNQHGKELDKLAQNSADFQADSVGSESLSSPFWVTSTIPGDWMWQHSSQFDGLSDQNIKRQSVCELEGDATVDDIVNQQFKMYTSLSQAPTDVKMVQSLLPIWEEEYERTGMREAAMPPDPVKPLPQDVLKILSLGMKFENVLAELCHEGEETISSFENDVKDLKSMTDPEHLSFLKEKNIIASLSPQGLLHGEEIGTASSQGKDVCPKLSCGGRIQSSEMATEIEALGLLKWLASSQAAEDLNSDDEILCATILSPLLPETTIDKVLEKANMDYERESQKECQDILDSVDVIRFDDLEERASRSLDPSNRTQISSEKKIPQVDGSSDDLHLCSAESAENSSKIEMKIESKMSLEHRLPQDTGPSFSSKQKKKKKLWGSLPFSVAQKVNDDLETDCVEISDTCVDESKDCRGTSFSTKNELAKGSIFSIENEVADACDTTTLIGCSVRDLMRKKRCYRVEAHESGSLGVKKLLLIGEQKEEISLSSKKLDFNSFQDDKQDKWPLEPSNHRPSLPLVSSIDSPLQVSTGLSSVHIGKRKLQCSFNTEKEGYAVLVNYHEADNSKESDLDAASSEDINCNFCASMSGSLLDVQLSKLDTEVKPVGDERLQLTSPIQCDLFTLYGSDSVDKNGNEIRISTGRVHAISEKKHVDTDITNDKSVLQNEKFIGQEQGQDSGVCGFGCSGSTSFNVEGKPLDLFAMTFWRKPPTPDSKDGQYENASCSSPAMPDHSYLVDEENHEGISGRALDNILPYFEQDFPVEKEFQNKWQKNSNCKSHQEDIIGVPTQYLNDGSCLYMLAPAFSPPTLDCVNRWLLCDEGAGEINKPSVEPSSPIGSNAMPVLEELHPETDGRVDIESNSDPKEEKIMLQSEGCIAEENACTDCLQDISQISGPDGRSRPTPLSQIGFRDPASLGAGEQLTLLSIEVQSESRGDLRPNPQYDAINVVVLAFQNDDGSVFEVYVLLRSNIESFQRSLDGIPDCKVFAFPDEKYLFSHFIKILLSFDPDILMGWDIQGGSLGFLAERAAHLGIGLLNDISRTPSETKIAAADLETSERGIPDNLQPESVIADPVVVENAIIEDEWGRTHASGVHVGGRIVLNVWRLMRGEVKLSMYTIEAVAEAVLRRKTPSIPYKVLTKWFSSGPGRARYRCIEYLVGRAKLNLEIMNQLDMINRTSELARVFGIDFFSVLSRGSQYRVESMFLRLAHTQNYLAISPGHQQVASQPAMECIPLVMEPESGFYSDPVVVLDFQSLYPSMIIAYNLCFCTCLGKVVPSKENTLGVSSFSPDPRVLRDLKDQILLTPNGVMYVPSKICKGVLPRLLEEILSTRIMVKQAMKKLAPSQQVLHRIFNARQLALKLIANVTYGYTAAGFSGRMPCAELADSIVQCGRSTLERAISFVNANDKWKARVIYGDTDSMFVLLKDRTVKESLQIGHEIASAITAMNPYPVVLKMEKVYHPCFLLTKKHYVGYSYESPDQTKPVFDAKGIETVRRDTCGAVSKMLEKSLKLFFELQDIYEVKAYLQRQWTRILSGRISLQDFVFAKEVRLGSYSRRTSSLPPAAIVATKAMRADPRAEPCYGERVLYVVIHGEPGARLVDMVVDPLDLLAIDSPYRLNDLYYINKQIIPALQRVFGLVGADLNHWFLEMPRPSRESLSKRPFHASNSRRSRIDFYYLSKHCILCGELVQASAPLCNNCSQNQIAAAAAIIGRTSKLEEDMQHLAAVSSAVNFSEFCRLDSEVDFETGCLIILQICRQCGGGDWLVETGVKCTSLACSVFYERRKVQKELQGLSTIAADKGYYPKCMVEWF
ncbi:hypothetical protein Ddye_028204 [Dipteronia dyeriana]|uniref:DNA polymerase zeta catalytic subunit n=1 Tax=Dipteronia dyeriana TaxID=168575 RepID=A0AAD9WQY1_9ROSI|nr:hypothetical protein Ddye_028204 [Dipteronia dyeriana]